MRVLVDVEVIAATPVPDEWCRVCLVPSLLRITIGYHWRSKLMPPLSVGSFLACGDCGETT